ncbi:hypothetical protein CR205_14580 [Alteribacter lacisalsi]|uniref:Uncharacterized protein n=1 Tax=Alteribacter lacisalsi TaxID=2045244 RepID=A0A2W0HJA8_9BACI|nr:hypothetical protein CR205_14580 [Alteribacter lacisalsi]
MCNSRCAGGVKDDAALVDIRKSCDLSAKFKVYPLKSAFIRENPNISAITIKSDRSAVPKRMNPAGRAHTTYKQSQ